MKVDELRREVGEQRARLKALEQDLARAERDARDREWFPKGFYAAYYILAGLVLGVIASWVTLGLNVVGAYLLREDPLKLLRVYSTILGGESTAEGSEAVVMMFALGIHTVVGAVCGAPIHVVYSRYFQGGSLVQRAITGVVLGLIMWLVNFYGILYWFQPLILGDSTSFIVESIEPWVAALTHVAFSGTVLLLQPFALFNATEHQSEEGGREG